MELPLATRQAPSQCCDRPGYCSALCSACASCTCRAHTPSRHPPRYRLRRLHRPCSCSAPSDDAHWNRLLPGRILRRALLNHSAGRGRAQVAEAVQRGSLHTVHVGDSRGHAGGPAQPAHLLFVRRSVQGNERWRVQLRRRRNRAHAQRRRRHPRKTWGVRRRALIFISLNHQYTENTHSTHQ